MHATFSLLLSVLPIAVYGEGSFSFDITADDGPNNWGTLNITDNECGGMAQSGINVPTSSCDVLKADYVFSPGTCKESDLTFKINDHVIQLTFDTSISNCTPPSMEIPNVDTVFDVLQYHIHAGSDHSLDNRHFGADMHIVHKDRNSGGLAVLGLFLEPTNPELSGHFDVLIAGLNDFHNATVQNCAAGSDSDSGNATDTELSAAGTRRRSRFLQDVYNPYAKVPANSTMYYYSGGLTTPPCSEIVSWNVVDTPVSISVQEYTEMIALIANFIDPTACEAKSVINPSGYTSRPVQPLNGRNITHLCPTGTEARFDTPPTSTTSAAATTTTKVMTLTFVMAILVNGMF